MTLKEIYLKAIKTGIDNDPRGRETVLKGLEVLEKEYSDMKPAEKDFFDTESLKNPYSDSRILNGDSDADIKNILVGIDIEVGEVVLADSLKNKGKGIDLIMAHHPEGTAYANLYSVMHMQSDILNKQFYLVWNLGR